MTNQVQVRWTERRILDFLHQHRAELKAMGVQKIGLFGSYVRNQQTRISDIDLLFSMSEMTFSRWMDVWNFLEDNFGCKVDLVPEKNLREELRPSVMAEVVYVPDL